MKCPKCVAPMVPVIFEGIEVDRCVDCHGLWFDESECEDLMNRRDSEAVDIGDAALGAEFDRVNCIVCPHCGNRMVPMVALGQSRVHFEQCAIFAGLFFDAGEFRLLKEHPSICLPAY